MVQRLVFLVVRIRNAQTLLRKIYLSAAKLSTSASSTAVPPRPIQSNLQWLLPTVAVIWWHIAEEKFRHTNNPCSLLPNRSHLPIILCSGDIINLRLYRKVLNLLLFANDVVVFPSASKLYYYLKLLLWLSCTCWCVIANVIVQNVIPSKVIGTHVAKTGKFPPRPLPFR